MLLHGRGADEHDLFPLLDVLDPERRLLGSRRARRSRCRRAARTGTRLRRHPDPTRRRSGRRYAALPAFLDGLPVPLDRIVLGGFSQGAVMSYALGLGQGGRGRRRSSRSPASSRRSTAGEPDLDRLAGSRSRSRTARSTRDPRRVRPRRARRARGRRRRRALPRVADRALDRPRSRSRPAWLRRVSRRSLEVRLGLLPMVRWCDGGGRRSVAMANATVERLPSITPTQREVIVLIAAGCSNDEV